MFLVDRNALPFEFPKDTLALTYDDGPGPHTLEIAEFLHDRGIAATFFVVGKHVRERRDVVGRVAALGHLIGNHTDTHTPLPDFASEPGKLVKEVMDADNEVRDFVGDRTFFLRTPGGHWDSSFATALNHRRELDRYNGPVNWTIAHGDYEIGSPRPLQSQNALYTFEECLHNYLRHIQKDRRGIVLLHDWSADSGPLGKELQSKNRTLELTKSMIPLLSGFGFVTLDKVKILS
jgi:peptidoglycan/xylan/chitin deacetylase (PgdA/CDA1 family)